MTVRFALLVFLLACKGGSECPAPPPATPAPKVAPAANDSTFVRIDRDQQAAACLSIGLPHGTYPSDHGALLLADGRRVPWLTVWVEEAAAIDEPPVLAKQWTARATEYVKHKMSLRDGPGTPVKGVETRNFPCSGDEAFDVVITGVFFEKAKFQIAALHAGKLMTEELSTQTPRDDVFRKAFELTEKLLGQSATIATHDLAGTMLSTVDTQPWLKAAKR